MLRPANDGRVALVCARFLRAKTPEVVGGEAGAVGESGVERWRDMATPLANEGSATGERLLVVRVRTRRAGVVGMG